MDDRGKRNFRSFILTRSGAARSKATSRWPDRDVDGDPSLSSRLLLDLSDRGRGGGSIGVDTTRKTSSEGRCRCAAIRWRDLAWDLRCATETTYRHGGRETHIRFAAELAAMIG